MKISIVIIGRNSENLIKKNYLENRNLLDFGEEVIFVDSDSTDDTVNMAKSKEWKVIELSDTGRLSAAAGRNIGTLCASGDYILFLDSDMTVNFSRNLIEFLIEKHIQNGKNIIGIGGMTLHLFKNGKQSMVLKKKKDGEITDSFGGFCLFDRKELLKIGNWNPNVIANEENELYARIKKNNKNVVLSREMVCFHHTENPSSGIIQLIHSYLPLNKKGIRLYGAPGLGLRAAFKSGSVFEYLYYFNSEVSLFLAFLIIGFVLLLSKVNLYLIIYYISFSLLILTLWVLRKRKWTFILLLPTYLLQMIIGFFRYNEKKIIIKNERKNI